MHKYFLAGIILLAICVAAWAENATPPIEQTAADSINQVQTASIMPQVFIDSKDRAFYPRLYIGGYNPIIDNQIELYKFSNGQNRYKTKPWEIPAFAPEYKETVDLANRKVILTVKVGDYPIANPVPISFERYFSNLQQKTFRKSLMTNLKTQTQTTQTTSSGLIKDVPLLPDIAIPKAVQKVIGSTAGKLNLDGTQKISLSASNTKRKQIPIYETGGNNTFDLKMEMESNLRLSGTIGDKIAINFKYNSKQDEQIFDMNNVNVKYTGSEDEFIKSIEGGNITLSLGGSRYVSYSASSQGLFGITSKFKYGNLDLSVIASKEESQKNTQSYVGKSQADSVSVSSWRFTKRTRYYLHDPYELFQLKSGDDIPEGWANNAIETSDDGSWIVDITNGDKRPANGTVRLWLDSPSFNTDPNHKVGFDIFYPDNYLQSYTPYWIEMTEGTDFVTDYSSGIVYLLRQVDTNASIGVRFTNRNGDLIPPAQPGDDASTKLRVKLLRKRMQDYAHEQYVVNESDSLSKWKTWHYQMRNVYDMGRTNIMNDGFSAQVYTVNADLTRNENLPDTLATYGNITYNDYLRLDSNGDHLINGNDSTVDLTNGWILMPFIEPFRALGDDIIYRKENESEYSFQDSTNLFISIKGKIGRDAIELSSVGILKGSVKVKVNGNDQRENVDYIVDYDFGRLTFLTAAGKDPEAKIEIEFESRTLFSVAQKNLAGVRADLKLTDTAKLGGTLIYRSENVADKRPRIGNENIEVLMGNVDGELSFKPGFITKWLDAIPLLKTTAPSSMSVTGEIAFTLPNIYGNPDGKKKEAYIDDMESIMDTYPLGVTFSTWVLGSKPFDTAFTKGSVNWFNAKDVKRKELEDVETLTDREQDEYASVLTLISKPNPLQMPGSSVHSWSGIMKFLGNQLDFSQKKYLELYVKLDSLKNVSSTNPNVTLHVDLGDMNEDFYTEYGGYNYLNTEDRNPKDGVLILDEDRGLDYIFKEQPGADPNDIAGSPTGNNYDNFAKVNGTEGNRVLDTEDLDGNGALNTLDRYFSYSVSLNNPDPEIVVATKGKWKLIRIPLTNSNYYQIVNSLGTNIVPTLNKISYARIWIDSPDTVMVRLADASIVGNKWQDNQVRQFKHESYNDTNPFNPIIDSEVLTFNNTSFASGNISNKNNPRYKAPQGTVFQENQRDTAESALTLEVNNLRRDHMCLLRQRMLDVTDLRSYSKMRFWVYPEANKEATAPRMDSLDVVMRIGADSLNYYQVRQRVPVRDYNSDGANMKESDWIELEYDMQKLVSLKEKNFSKDLDSLYTVAGNIPTNYYYRGKPNLINIRELYLGVYIPSTDIYNHEIGNNLFSGTIFFNDFRVAEPYEDLGVAKRLSFSGIFADFATLNVDLEDKSENFNTIIQRGRANTYTRTQSLSISNKYFLNKFFPNSWNLDIPISLARNYSMGTPRFRANSDLLRENIVDPERRNLEKTERLTYSADFGFSQKVAPKSKILQYTIYRTSLSGRVEKGFNNSSTARDSLLAYRGTLNYNLNIPSEKTSFKLFKNYRLAFFPNTFSNSFTFSANEPIAWDRNTTIDSLVVWTERTQTADTRTFTTDNNLSWNILSDLTATARLNTKRDLKQKDRSFYDINIGKLNEYVQDLGLNFNPAYFPRVFNFTSSASARYSDTQRKYTTSENVDAFQRDGNSNRSTRLNVTLMNSTILEALAQKMKSKEPKKDDKTPPEDKKDEPMPDDKKDQQIKDEEQKKLEQQRQDDELKKLEQMKQDEEIPKQEDIELDKQPNTDKESEFDKPETDDKDQPLTNDAIELNEIQDTATDSTGIIIPPQEPKPKKPPIDPVYSFFNLLSRVKNINAAYQNSYTMNYLSKVNPYPFSFQIGMPLYHVGEDSLGLESIANDNTLTLGSGITISRKLDSVINYSYTNNTREASASNKTIGYTFPDITLSLMDFETLVGLGKYISGSRLNTGFQYTYRQTGTMESPKPKQRTFTTALNPLLGFTGNLFKVVTTNLSYSVSKTENETDLSINDSETNFVYKNQNSQTMNGSVSYSFRSGKGFTIPFTKRKIHIKNELTSTLAVTYENNFDETTGLTTTVVDRNTSKFSISPQASYQFDTNIRGGLNSSYEVNSDKKRDDGTSIFSLGIWVEVNL